MVSEFQDCGRTERTAQEIAFGVTPSGVPSRRLEKAGVRLAQMNVARSPRAISIFPSRGDIRPKSCVQSRRDKTSSAQLSDRNLRHASSYLLLYPAVAIRE